MKRRFFSVIVWSARIVGIGTSAFLAMFALDALGAGKPLWQTVTDLLVHLMPSLAVLAVVILSWRRQWLGALAFVSLAVAYALLVNFRPDWVLAISGPLLTAGLLFFWAWRLNPRFTSS